MPIHKNNASSIRDTPSRVYAPTRTKYVLMSFAQRDDRVGKQSTLLGRLVALCCTRPPSVENTHKYTKNKQLRATGLFHLSRPCLCSKEWLFVTIALFPWECGLAKKKEKRRFLMVTLFAPTPSR